MCDRDYDNETTALSLVVFTKLLLTEIYFIFVCQILPWKSQSLRDTMTGFAKLKH